eukprot:6172262-Pleurochrysis_carterae.AAC.1
MGVFTASQKEQKGQEFTRKNEAFRNRATVEKSGGSVKTTHRALEVTVSKAREQLAYAILCAIAVLLRKMDGIESSDGLVYMLAIVLLESWAWRAGRQRWKSCLGHSRQKANLAAVA